MKRSSKKGFTLIELIIVIAILAILAVIIIPKIIGTKGAAQIGVDRTNAKQVQNALAQYYAEFDMYPVAGNANCVSAVKDKTGKEPVYKNGKTMISGYTTNGDRTSYSVTFAADTGCAGVPGYNQHLTMGADDDTNGLFKN